MFSWLGRLACIKPNVELSGPSDHWLKEYESMNMKKIVTVLGVLAFVTTIALAQSSGNFSYGYTGGLHCILNQGNGAITGGATCSSRTDCSGNGGDPLPTPGGVCEGAR